MQTIAPQAIIFIRLIPFKTSSACICNCVCAIRWFCFYILHDRIVIPLLFKTQKIPICQYVNMPNFENLLHFKNAKIGEYATGPFLNAIHTPMFT